MSRIAESFMPGLFDQRSAPYSKSLGFKEPTTSREAARKFRVHATDLRAAVLREIAAAADGLTADEVAARLKASVLAIRPRVSELREQGKIERVPALRRRNASGMNAAVWRIKVST